MLGAIAARTERIGLATGVTCPCLRYHPAIIAQAAATSALLSRRPLHPRRRRPGSGSTSTSSAGASRPCATRHELLREALEIIRLLWQGGYQSWAPDEDAAASSAHRLIRFGPLGWKVQAELPNPVNFEAATTFVTPDDLKQTVACGPDPERHLEVASQFADAGFDHLALLNAGPDPDGFFDFFTRELADPLRALAAK